MVCAFILLPGCHDTNAELKKCFLFLSFPFLHCIVLTNTAKVICYLLEVVVLSLKLFSPQLLLQPVPVQTEMMRLPDVLSLTKVKKYISSYAVLQSSGNNAAK